MCPSSTVILTPSTAQTLPSSHTTLTLPSLMVTITPGSCPLLLASSTTRSGSHESQWSHFSKSGPCALGRYHRSGIRPPFSSISLLSQSGSIFFSSVHSSTGPRWFRRTMTHSPSLSPQFRMNSSATTTARRSPHLIALAVYPTPPSSVLARPV
jgi:hypothetical protein